MNRYREEEMKVLFVASELYPWKTGGPQNVVYNLANQLSDRIDVQMLCIPPPDEQDVSRYYNDDIAFSFLPERKSHFLKYLFRNISYIRESRECEDFDLVHFHILPGANCAFLPGYLKRNYQAELVLSIYDWVPEELKFYDTAEKMKHIMHWTAAKPGFKHFDYFVVNSSYVKRIVEDYGLRMVKIMPNGINVDEWRTSQRKELKGSVNILFWGRLYPKKGVEPLIRSFASTAEKHQDIQLYIGGKGPDEEDYRRLCRDLNLGERVTFLGGLSREDLKAYLNSCEFCVFPSIYEGFGISVLEAMAASKPVITSKRGGQADFARDGYNALLVDLDQPDSLVRAMEEMIVDTKMRKDLAENAAKTATQYGWSNIADKYIEFYQSMIEGKV